METVQNQQVVRKMLEQVEAHAKGMWRYRWRAIALTWIICMIGWYSVYSMPDVYQANARIYVDTENVITPLLRGIAATSDVMSEVTVVTREMLSRPNLAEVARATDLDLRASSEEQFERLLDSLGNRIEVVGGRENIFTISFQDPDRDKAVAVVDSLVETFVEKSLGADRSESSKAQSFLQQQIREYEERLTVSEDRLADFKRKNVALMPGQEGDYFSRLQTAREALSVTTTELSLAAERRAELLRQLEGEEPVFGIVPVDPGTSTSAADGSFTSSKIRELEAQLEELRLRYTDKHPRIGQILETIEFLKQQKANEPPAAVGEDAGSPGEMPSAVNPLDLNPVYQNMRIQLTNTDVEIASLRARLASQQSEVNELQDLVDTVPQVEAELNRLNRDYGVVKAKYEQLLQQLETANIGEDVEQSIDDVQFRVIDPPFAASEPSGPQREMFMAMVFIGALGAGGALAFLWNTLSPVFFSGRMVSEIAGIPVLGSVSLMLSTADAKARRNGNIRFALAFVVLVASFATLSVFSTELALIVRDVKQGFS